MHGQKAGRWTVYMCVELSAVFLGRDSHQTLCQGEKPEGERHTSCCVCISALSLFLPGPARLCGFRFLITQ